MSNRELQRSHVRCCVLVDFDGTIAPDDPTDRLLERFAEPQWRIIEDAWQAGKLSSRECMGRQVELLRATPRELDEEIGKVRIDPSFRTFLDFCRCRGAEVTIVSDGFDRVVRAALENSQLDVPFFANTLEWRGDDRWRLAFPHWRSDCRVKSANCKCSHGERFPSLPRVVIGDGRSDFCMSTRAEYVIAKGALADFCRGRGQDHESFGDFDDVTTHLAAWLATADASPARTPFVFSSSGEKGLLES
jgi:2-hydroxy-3-keto-5-methylthiopentenyl-1-phosphate phosphatase